MNFNSEIPWRAILREASRSPHETLCSSVCSPDLPQLVEQAAAGSFRAGTAKYSTGARAVIEQAAQEKVFVDQELVDKLRKKRRESIRLNQPLKPWTFMDRLNVIILAVGVVTGVAFEWNAVSQTLTRVNPLQYYGTWVIFASSGLIILFPLVIKAACPDIRENVPGNRRYRLVLCVLSIIGSLIWCICFSARSDESPFNDLATQLISPVLDPSVDEFESRLFFAQMLSQILGAAMISAFLFLCGEAVIKTRCSRSKIKELAPVSSNDIDLEGVQTRHRNLVAAAARARAMLDEIREHERAFKAEWVARVSSVLRAKEILESHIGPFSIGREDDTDIDS